MGIKNLIIRNNNISLDDVNDWDTTPWQKDTDNPITKSNVDSQDELSIEDLLEGGDVNVANALSNQVKQLMTQNGIYSIYSKYKNTISNIKGTNGHNSERPSGTSEEWDDKLGANLQKLKDAKYKKNVKLTSKIGLYNNWMNLLGNAAGLYVGSLGKTTATQIADTALTMTHMTDLTLGLGADAIWRIIKSLKGRENGKFSSVDVPIKDLLKLNIANFFTINEFKPGLTIRDTNTELVNWVTNGEGNGLSEFLSEFGSKSAGLVTDLAMSLQAEKEKKLISNENLKNYKQNFGYLSFDDLSGNDIQKSRATTGQTIINGVIEEIGEDNTSSNKEYLDKVRKNLTALSRLNKLGAQDYSNYFDNLKEKNDGYVPYRDWRKIYSDTIYSSLARIGETDKNGAKGIEIGDVDQYIDDWENNKDDKTAEFEGFNGRDNFKHDSNGNRLKRPTNYKANGGLYIEPFYNSASGIQTFFIPFEFNADIQEGGMKAEYTAEQILGRVIGLKSYIRSDAGNIIVNTQYMALHKKDDTNKHLTDIWMEDWSVERIRDIEKLYRSLVLPYIESNSNSSTFIRPPIIRIIEPQVPTTDYNTEFGFTYANSTVNDLFKYPESVNDNKNLLQITKIFDKDDDLKTPEPRVKRYVATDLSITPMSDNWNTTYGLTGYGTVKNGFKVSLTLSETTKNFLDTIPTYASYTVEGGSKDGDKYSNITNEYRDWDKAGD